MPNPTAEKEGAIAKESAVVVPALDPSSKRAILWNPDRDPGAYSLPKGTIKTRPFAMPYLDESRMAITPLSKGEAVPSFKSIALSPGLNWIKVSEWDSALAAAARYGQPSEMPTPTSTAPQRLSASTNHGVDPIQSLVEAGAIVVLKHRLTALSGTINDYDQASIKRAVELQDDSSLLNIWKVDVQANSIDPHPQKVKIVEMIDRRVAEIASGVSR